MLRRHITRANQAPNQPTARRPITRSISSTINSSQTLHDTEEICSLASIRIQPPVTTTSSRDTTISTTPSVSDQTPPTTATILTIETPSGFATTSSNSTTDAITTNAIGSAATITNEQLLATTTIPAVNIATQKNFHTAAHHFPPSRRTRQNMTHLSSVFTTRTRNPTTQPSTAPTRTNIETSTNLNNSTNATNTVLTNIQPPTTCTSPTSTAPTEISNQRESRRFTASTLPLQSHTPTLPALAPTNPTSLDEQPIVYTQNPLRPGNGRRRHTPGSSSLVPQQTQPILQPTLVNDNSGPEPPHESRHADPQDPNATLIGRRVLADTTRGIFPGTIEHVSYHPLTNAASFHVQYDNNQGVAEFSFAELSAILLPVSPCSANFHSSAHWTYCKRTYRRIRLELLEDSALTTDRTAIARVYGFHSPDTITPAALEKKFKNIFSRKWHPDKIGTDSPAWVRYTAKVTLLALRFIKEMFQRPPGEESSIDAPTLATFPEYGSQQHLIASGLDPINAANADLSQADYAAPIDDSYPQNLPTDQLPRDHDHNTGGTPADNRSKAPFCPFSAASNSPLEDPDAPECADSYPLDDYTTSPFNTYEVIPPALACKWARVYSRSAKLLIDAAQSAQEHRDKKLATAIRWYTALPQLILRDTGRKSSRKLHILESRMDHFLAGRLSITLRQWRGDLAKLHKRTPHHRKEADPVKRAINLIYDGFISRATRLVEGFGHTSCDNPAIRDQMLSKHPQIIPTWDTVHPREDGKDVIDLSHLHDVIRELDPKVGVGPRRLHADHIRKLLNGRMTDPESRSALPLFQELGILYLNCTLPPWVRAILGGGLLTPLNKNQPGPDHAVDARPVKAEDTDTSIWVKALGRAQAPIVRSVVLPQQLGVGVSGGVQLQAIGLNLKFDEAQRNNRSMVIVVSDIENAHNSFSRELCKQNVSAAVEKETLLAPLLLALQATISTPTPIYTRTELTTKGMTYLCDSCQGGGQGNALTGLAFVLTIDPILKGLERTYPTVEARAIHDDITLSGPPEEIFGDDKALNYLIDGLRNIAGCTPKLQKFKALGSLPHSCENMPEFIKRPSVTSTNPLTGSLEESYGLEICGVPIGEECFRKNWLASKASEIAKTIEDTSSKLASRDLHAAHTTLQLSLQNRADYILSTNLPSDSHAFSSTIDDATATAYSNILDPGLLSDTSADPHFPDDPSFTRDRFHLKTSRGGGGYRPIQSHRTPFLNCLNNILPQCLDAPVGDPQQTIRPGLWPSLTSILGNNSFHPDNAEHRWQFFFNSGSPYGTELKSEWTRLQDLKAELIHQLPQGIQNNYTNRGPLTADAESFGGNHANSLHKDIFDSIQEIRHASLMHRASKLARNDPRRLSFLASHADKFSNCLLSAPPDRTVQFSHSEFREAITTHFGLPSPTCYSIIGKKINNHQNSIQLRVDRYGFNLKTITGATGDHTRTFHDNIVATISQSMDIASIPHRGGPYRTCKNLFSHLLAPTVDLTGTNSRHLQGIIPDLLIDASRLFTPSTGESLHGRITLTDVKTLAPGSAYTEQSNLLPNEAATKRASAVNNQYHSHAQSLDQNILATPPGTIGPIERELNTYGHNGRVLGACVGAFGECSPDIYSLRDLISHCQALQLMDNSAISLPEAMSIFKLKILRTWGLTFARGWARLLLTRRRDLVSCSPASHPTQPLHPTRDPCFPDPYDLYHHWRRHTHPDPPSFRFRH